MFLLKKHLPQHLSRGLSPLPARQLEDISQVSGNLGQKLGIRFLIVVEVTIPSSVLGVSFTDNKLKRSRIFILVFGCFLEQKVKS